MTDTTPQDTPDVVAAALTDGATTLFVADFADTSTAWEAYEALKSVEDGRHVAIDGVIVVKRETDGDLVVQKATDHRPRGSPGVWSAEPHSACCSRPRSSAAPLPWALEARHWARPVNSTTASSSTHQLENAITPGHSGIVAIVSDPAVLEIRRALERADAVVESALDDVVAKDIKALAKEAEKE